MITVQLYGLLIAYFIDFRYFHQPGRTSKHCDCSLEKAKVCFTPSHQHAHDLLLLSQSISCGPSCPQLAIRVSTKHASNSDTEAKTKPGWPFVLFPISVKVINSSEVQNSRAAKVEESSLLRRQPVLSLGMEDWKPGATRRDVRWLCVHHVC